MNKTLINAVVHQLGDKDYLQDVANHGAYAGYPGFTYYTDTVAFYKRQRANILELLKEQSSEFGYRSVIDFVSSFNCLKGYAEDDEGQAEIARALYGRIKSDDTQVCNALAWYALEEVARFKTNY